MRKNKRTGQFIPAKQITKQQSLAANKMLERRPQKRAVFHRIGGRNQ